MAQILNVYRWLILPRPQDDLEKAEQCALAEVLTGLLASGAPFAAGADWPLAALSTCLRGASLDMMDSWVAGIRCGAAWW